jgi:hypothetical protein
MSWKTEVVLAFVSALLIGGALFGAILLLADKISRMP